jgi:hypothetical protein
LLEFFKGNATIFVVITSPDDDAFFKVFCD